MPHCVLQCRRHLRNTRQCIHPLSQCRKVRCHVFVGGLGQQRFGVDALCKRCGLLTFQVGIQASSTWAPLVLARDPVPVHHLLIGASTLIDSSSLIDHRFRKVTQMHHVILGSLQITRDHRFGDGASVLNQRWVLEATFATLIESNLTGDSVHCIRDVALCHGSNQSLACHQAHTLCFRQFDLAGIGHGQCVFDHILSQGLRRIFGTGVDFRNVVQADLFQNWSLGHALTDSTLHGHNLLRAFNVGHGLVDARQVIALRGAFLQAFHDGTDFGNACQTFNPIRHLVEVRDSLDELSSRFGSLGNGISHADHMIGEGYKRLGHIAGSAQLCRQIGRQHALGNVLLVLITIGECRFQRGQAIELCSLGFIIQGWVALDGLCSSNVQLLLCITYLCSNLGVLLQVCGHWNQGLRQLACSRRFCLWYFGGAFRQLSHCLLSPHCCHARRLQTTCHQPTKQCTSTNLLTYTIAQGLGLVSMALDRRVACHLAHTTLNTFFQELGADVGQRRLQAGRGHGSSFKACHQFAHSNCSRGCNHGGFQACLVGQSSAGFLWGQPLLHQLGELRRLHGQVCELHAQHIIGCLLERTTGFHRTNESSNTALICSGSQEAGLVFSKDACGTASSEHLGISGSSYSGERADPN